MAFLDKKMVGKRLIEFRLSKNYHSARKFAMEAGIDQSQYAKIEKGDLPITENIIEKLSIKYGIDKEFILYGHGKNVPHETKPYPEHEETGQILNDPDPNEHRPPQKNRAAREHENHSQAIVSLSESIRLIAESNTILSRSNEELVGLLKAAIAGVHAETQASVDAMLIGLRELLLETAAGQRYKSVEEAGAAYRKKLGDVLKGRKAAGIRTG